jgi:hypothetical protein
VAAIDMGAVFRAAGLDKNTFAETVPRLLPEHAADQVLAWKGPHPKIPDTQLTVEIATWKGRVTQVEVEFPVLDADPVAAVRSLWQGLRDAFLKLALGVAGFFGILLARSNWKKERVDKKGALRLAAACFALVVVTWSGLTHPIASGGMWSFLWSITANALLDAAILWVLYLALEPAVRARWPHAIVTWNRMLAGRWQDAQVGSHILIGAALGTAAWALLFIPMGPKNTLSSGISLWPLLGTRQWVASYAANLADALMFGPLYFFTIFGLRRILKRDWLAAIAASVLFTLSQNELFTDAHWERTAATFILLYSILMFVLLRVGLVTLVSALFFLNALNRLCLGFDLHAWWAADGLATMTLIIAMASYAFWRSIGTRELTQ